MALLIAKFDSYRQFETPLMHVCNPGCVYKNGLLTNVAGVLNDAGDIELIPTFNAVSELNFRVYRTRYEDPEDNAYFYSLYRSLKNKRLIFLDGVGFFVITEVSETSEGEQQYKDIKAGSCEVELQNKAIPYIANGTYKFYTGEAGSPGMIERLIAATPMWTIGHIDDAVAERYRTFEDVDITLNILGFALNELQDAYECLFIFDIVNRVVNVYDQANYVRPTNIHITKEDVINSLDISESSDELYTAISVTGDEELSINAVNPLGTNVIYKFDYYLEWMTEPLRNKVAGWQKLVKDSFDEYYNLQLAKYDSMTELSVLRAENDRINTQLEMYRRCRENIVAESSTEDIAAYNDVIIEIGGLPIPEGEGFTWFKFADDAYGTNLSEDPYGKNYIGISYDQSSSVPSISPADYEWHTFRNGETFARTVDGTTVYTWVVFADSTISGMGNDPDEKKYIGVALDKEVAEKSEDYDAYTWQLLNTGNLGVPQVLMRIVSLIEQTEAELKANEIELAELESLVAERNNRAAIIQNSVAMANYFTAEELDELSNYISEGSYTDEYVAITDSMSYADRFKQMKLLYDRAQTQLEKISTPTQEINIDVKNFIFEKEFEEWSHQLETGCLINVELDTDDVAALFLCSFNVNYEDKKLNMTFGNRYNRFDPKSLFEDVLGNISRTANTLSYIKDTIYPIKNGEFNAMKEALETSRTLTKNSVLSSANEQVVIDDTGYTGKRKLSDGTIDPKQIKINGRNIVFTDDAWETCRTAIGELVLSDGGTAYGINAEVLLGDIIMGNELHILNSDGEDMFKVTEDSIMLRVGDSYASKEDTLSGVDVEYCRATSNIVPLDESTITVGWSTSSPPWENGEYVWQRTVTHYENGSSNISDATCISGAQGQDGEGIGIETAEILYSLSVDGVNPPDNGWQPEMPVVSDGEFLWTMTKLSYTDGSETIAYSISGAKGNDGISGADGRGIESTTTLYAVSDSGIAPPASGTGENLININSMGSEQNGVSFLINSDGSINCVGTTTEENVFFDLNYNVETPVCFGPGEYIVSGGSESVAVQILINSSVVCESVGEAVNFSVPTDASDCWVRLRILPPEAGIEVNETIYPTVTAHGVEWSDTLPSSIGDGMFLWVRTVLTYSDGDIDEFYSVSANGAGISSITEEYYLSSSDTEQLGGEWTTIPPVWTSGKYIWTRSHIVWDNGNEKTTSPVLDNTWNQMGATIDTCVTDVSINKRGIEQNTAFYQELYGMVAKINAYIQTGVISTDEAGKTTFGVKIGENFASTDAYLVSGAEALSEGWLSSSDGGVALTPMDAIIYTIKTPGEYYGKFYRWNGTAYEETSSEGTLSSIFTSSELGFYDTGEKTAYFSNKNLNVRTVRTNKILLSENVIDDTSSNNWQIGIDNGFYLKWVGGA